MPITVVDKTIEELFDHLPGIVYFCKNLKGEYIAVNQTLVERCGAVSKSEILGRTPSDTHGQLGEGYEQQDKKVLETGRSLVNQLELHSYATGKIGWCLTTKKPIRDETGKIIGLVGVSQDLVISRYNEDYQQIQNVVDFAKQNLAKPPDISTLSQVAGLSPYQLDKRMRRVFGLSTGQWLLQQRLEHAQNMLVSTNDSIADIALSSGYRDQSAFSRQFKASIGLTPGNFRRVRRGSGARR